MHEEGENITDIKIARILNHFNSVFTSDNLNVPDFNMLHRKKIEAPITYFRINEVINKNIRNLSATEGHWVHQGCWISNLKSKI